MKAAQVHVEAHVGVAALLHHVSLCRMGTFPSDAVLWPSHLVPFMLLHMTHIMHFKISTVDCVSNALFAGLVNESNVRVLARELLNFLMTAEVGAKESVEPHM